MTGLRALLNNVHARGEALRYLTVVAVGSVVDLSIAWTAHEILGVQIIAAAALGFVIASVLSYFVHEFWTFRSAGSGFSATRLGKFGAASAVTLTMRMTLVWITFCWLRDQPGLSVRTAARLLKRSDPPAGLTLA